MSQFPTFAHSNFITSFNVILIKSHDLYSIATKSLLHAKSKIAGCQSNSSLNQKKYMETIRICRIQTDLIETPALNLLLTVLLCFQLLVNKWWNCFELLQLVKFHSNKNRLSSWTLNLNSMPSTYQLHLVLKFIYIDNKTIENSQQRRKIPRKAKCIIFIVYWVGWDGIENAKWKAFQIRFEKKGTTQKSFNANCLISAQKSTKSEVNSKKERK